MTTSPSNFINSPVSGTVYYAGPGYRFQPTSGSWTATVKAWSGANGTGSLVSTSLTAYARDYQTSTDQNSFSGSGVTTVSATGSTTTDTCVPGGKYVGSGVGSLELFAVYTGQADVPFIGSGMSPTAGGVGTVVTFSGTESLMQGVTAVDLNGTSASFSITSDNSATATVPAGATTGVWRFTNPQGSGTSPTFTVANAYVNTGTSGSPVWTAASQITANTGTSGSPVQTQATQVAVNTGTSGSPVWTPSG